MRNLYKQILVLQLTQFMYLGLPDIVSPIAQLWQCACNYNLDHDIRNMMESGEYITKAEFKGTVTKKVLAADNLRLKQQCKCYKQLVHFSQQILEVNAKPIVWWQLAKMRPWLLKQCKFMVKLLTGTHDLNNK